MTVGSMMIGSLAALLGTRVVGGADGQPPARWPCWRSHGRCRAPGGFVSRTNPETMSMSKPESRAQTETPLEPELPICDAHHHLWERRAA